jgi:hypothetical protein
VLVAAACNQVYGLDPTLSVDGSTSDALADEDHDGTPDLTDNCVGLANDQADEDADGRGNVCDNCPLFANADQDDFDGEGVGDVCDPQPKTPNDCLIVFDSFDNAGAFAQHWRVLADATANATAEPLAESIVLHPKLDRELTLIALDDAGMPLLGTFDVQMIGRADLTTGSAAVGTRILARNDGYWGGVGGDTPVDNVQISASSTSGGATWLTGMSTARVGNRFAIRMITDNPAALRASMHVRVDYGVSLGTLDITSDLDVAASGSPGIVATLDDIEVLAFVAYRRQPPPCPPPLMR